MRVERLVRKVATAVGRPLRWTILAFFFGWSASLQAGSRSCDALCPPAPAPLQALLPSGRWRRVRVPLETECVGIVHEDIHAVELHIVQKNYSFPGAEPARW